MNFAAGISLLFPPRERQRRAAGSLKRPELERTRWLWEPGRRRNYEKSLWRAQERAGDVVCPDWPEEQARRPAKNNLLNARATLALSSRPDKTALASICARSKAGRVEKGDHPPRNLARFAFKGERLDRDGERVG